jgi:hypothetical protein
VSAKLTPMLMSARAAVLHSAVMAAVIKVVFNFIFVS